MDNRTEYYLFARKKSEQQIRDEHPMFCVCGRPYTPLHKCAKFKKTVARRTDKILKQMGLYEDLFETDKD